MSDVILHELMERIERLAIQLDRVASAMERTNALSERLMRCPGCMGDGKGYGDVRCIRCGGSGIKQ